MEGGTTLPKCSWWAPPHQTPQAGLRPAWEPVIAKVYGTLSGRAVRILVQVPSLKE